MPDKLTITCTWIHYGYVGRAERNHPFRSMHHGQAKEAAVEVADHIFGKGNYLLTGRGPFTAHRPSPQPSTNAAL